MSSFKEFLAEGPQGRPLPGPYISSSDNKVSDKIAAIGDRSTKNAKNYGIRQGAESRRDERARNLDRDDQIKSGLVAWKKRAKGYDDSEKRRNNPELLGKLFQRAGRSIPGLHTTQGSTSSLAEGRDKMNRAKDAGHNSRGLNSRLKHKHADAKRRAAHKGSSPEELAQRGFYASWSDKKNKATSEGLDPNSHLKNIEMANQARKNKEMKIHARHQKDKADEKKYKDDVSSMAWDLLVHRVKGE